MKITSSLYFRIGLGVLCAVIIVEGALMWANFVTRRRAEALLASLQTLKIGTSIEEIQPILSSYNVQRQTTANCYFQPTVVPTYSVLVANKTVNYVGYTFPSLLRLGVRPVGFTAMLSFADGRLCRAIYSADALVSGNRFSEERQKRVKAVDLWASTSLAPSYGGSPETNYNIRPMGGFMGGFRWKGWIRGIQASVTTATIPTEMTHAMTFDFSCFTAIRGCNSPDQMLPLAAADANNAPK